MVSPLPSRRSFDHVVLPAADLSVARARLSQLGFTVAPDGRHPFGTANACVYFADRTFLEPLAVASRETAEAAAKAGNAFVARDAAWRFRCGEDGFSALAMTSGDARADDRHYREEGLHGGDILTFGRDFVTPDGQAKHIEFRLAFAADLRSPDAFFFACQRLAGPAVDRSALENHANGVRSLRAVVLAEDNPTDFQYLLQTISGQRDIEAHSFGMDVHAANANLQTLTPVGLKAHFGVAAPAGRGLRFVGLVLDVADIAATKALLDRHGVGFHERLGRLVVPAAPGQGYFIAFGATP